LAPKAEKKPTAKKPAEEEPAVEKAPTGKKPKAEKRKGEDSFLSYEKRRIYKSNASGSSIH
jgi:hypothetical protein